MTPKEYVKMHYPKAECNKQHQIISDGVVIGYAHTEYMAWVVTARMLRHQDDEILGASDETDCLTN